MDVSYMLYDMNFGTVGQNAMVYIVFSPKFIEILTLAIFGVRR
jgi:hypothetical protein